MEDMLSPLTREIMGTGTYTRLVVNDGTPTNAREMLAAVTPDQLLSVPIRSYPFAFAMLSGLWLWHDGLSESHEIAQQSPEKLHRNALNLHSKGSKVALNVRSMDAMESDKELNQHQLRNATDTLSFWHAIMHRREGDFWNSKYWYARCRSHPSLAGIATRAEPLVATLLDRKLAGRLSRGGWDADAFVDWVEEVAARPESSSTELVAKLQKVEWQALFDHCARGAAGRQI